jgi:hypothetical protein
VSDEDSEEEDKARSEKRGIVQALIPELSEKS